jgi:hypothetical protein
MTYGRFFNGKGLLSARNIFINFVLPFLLNNGGRLWDCKLNKDSPGRKGNIRRRSYISETNFVGWALLD